MKAIHKKVSIGIVLVLLGALAVTWISAKNPQIAAFVRGTVQKYGLLGVFVITIASGTVVPTGSPLIVAYASSCGIPPIPLTLVAASGYTIGTATSYTLAYFLGEEYVSKRISQETLQSLTAEWNQRGYILAVVFSLVPGFPVDLLAVVCGVLKTKPLPFFTLSWVTLTVQFGLCVWLGTLMTTLDPITLFMIYRTVISSFQI